MYRIIRCSNSYDYIEQSFSFESNKSIDYNFKNFITTLESITYKGNYFNSARQTISDAIDICRKCSDAQIEKSVAYTDNKSYTDGIIICISMHDNLLISLRNSISGYRCEIQNNSGDVLKYFPHANLTKIFSFLCNMNDDINQDLKEDVYVSSY